MIFARKTHTFPLFLRATCCLVFLSHHVQSEPLPHTGFEVSSWYGPRITHAPFEWNNRINVLTIQMIGAERGAFFKDYPIDVTISTDVLRNGHDSWCTHTLRRFLEMILTTSAVMRKGWELGNAFLQHNSYGLLSGKVEWSLHCTMPPTGQLTVWEDVWNHPHEGASYDASAPILRAPHTHEMYASQWLRFESRCTMRHRGLPTPWSHVEVKVYNQVLYSGPIPSGHHILLRLDSLQEDRLVKLRQVSQILEEAVAWLELLLNAAILLASLILLVVYRRLVGKNSPLFNLCGESY